MDRRALNDIPASNPPPAPPLSPVTLHVLVALGDGPRHGYAMMHQVVARGVRDVALAPGTLYRVLDRLRTDGLITEIDARPALERGDTRRRFYHLTERGRQAALAEKRRLVALIAAMDATTLFRDPGAADTPHPSPRGRVSRQEEAPCAD
jgi:DNA-binding PadR family transcriptional regulator